jgi:hypothetical protein
MITLPHIFSYFHIYFWTDLLEISVMSSFFYFLSRWLARDTTHKLIVPWYSYCTLLVATYFFQCTTLNFLLLFFAPAIAMLFMLAHQEMLQKNFIPFKKITPAMVVSARMWIDTLFQLSLYARSHNKIITFIIEKNDPLDAYLNKALSVNTQLESALVKHIIESIHYDDTRLIWITNTGFVRALGAHFSLPLEQAYVDKQYAHNIPWLAHAIACTKKSDALIVHTNTNDTCLIICQGAIIELTAPQAHAFIKQYLGVPVTKKGDSLHDYAYYQNYSQQQSHP